MTLDAEFRQSISLRTTVEGYLASRFYPPLPPEYVEIVLHTLDLLGDGDTDNVVVLPHGISPKPAKAYWSDDHQAYVVDVNVLADILRVDRLVQDWLDVFGEEG